MIDYLSLFKRLDNFKQRTGYQITARCPFPDHNDRHSSFSGEYRNGTWNCKINSPMGSQEGKITLVTDGDSLSGKMEGPQGTQEFDGGSVAGNNLSWKMEMTSPMPMTLDVSASVDGDEISGNIKLGAFGDASFTGTRA